MNNIIISYVLYLLISIALTVWVGHTLFKHGRLFLIDTFHGNQELAHAVNRLLLVGFYLINVGYCVFTLKIFSDINDGRAIFEVLSIKIGKIILILGALHFLNLLVFYKLRKRALDEKKYINRYKTENPL
jgi:hypothetical protein